ncbi:MAG: hypothetical protein AB7F85_04540 [Hyphomonadaceae bacterium]
MGRSNKGSAEHPRELQAALRDLREHLTANGVSKNDAIECAALVERLARAFCAGKLIGAVRDPLSPHKSSVQRLANALNRAAIVARGVQTNPAVARDLSTYRRARDRKRKLLAYGEFVDQLDAWTLTAERLLQDIAVRRGPDADDAALALYTRYALAFRRYTGEWPRGWRQAKNGGEPESWLLLNMIVGAISIDTESRLTPKRFYAAIQRLATESQPISGGAKE